jgi:hypothetical protein
LASQPPIVAWRLYMRRGTRKRTGRVPNKAHPWRPGVVVAFVVLVSVRSRTCAQVGAFPVDGSSLTIPKLTVDAVAAAWLDPGEEFPTDDVQGESVTLTPKKLGLVTGIDVEAIEDASVATLDVVGNSLAKAIAQKLDARVFSTAAADKGPAGLLGTFTPLAKALGVIPLLEAVATIQSKGGSPDTIYVNPADLVTLRTEPTETGGKLPLLGVGVSQTGAQSVDGLALSGSARRSLPGKPWSRSPADQRPSEVFATRSRSVWRHDCPSPHCGAGCAGSGRRVRARLMWSSTRSRRET